MKIVKIFQLKIVIFTAVKYRCILHGNAVCQVIHVSPYIPIPDTLTPLLAMRGAPIPHLGERRTLDRDRHPGRGVVSLSKTFHPHCLVPGNPRKQSQHHGNISVQK